MYKAVLPALLRLPAMSRRREPRIAVRDLLVARAISPEGPEVLAVRDLGFRGFALETESGVQPNTRARFEFHSAGMLLFEAEAVAVHCLRQPGETERWISGWEFPEQPGLDAQIERLLDEAVGILTIE